MAKNKKIGVFILLLMGYNLCHAQIFTVERERIVYGSSAQDADSSIKKQYSILCSNYIKQYYSKRKLPTVYLVISKSAVDTSVYELAYDNLSGHPSSYQYHGANRRYNQPGIRIKIYSNREESENLLKLLDYGINNLKELKRIRKSVLKKDYYDQPDTLSLSSEKIEQILNTPSTDSILSIIAQINKSMGPQ